MTAEIIKINRVDSNPIGPDYRYKLNEEWIEIKNNLATYLELYDWKIWHKAQPSGKFMKAYEFGSFRLAGGSNIKIHTGSGTDTTADIFMNRGNFIWNNTGDEAHLDDEKGQTVSRKIVPPTER